MQKRWMAAAAAALILTGVGTGAWAATSLRQKIEVEYRGIQIKVDGQPVMVDAEPFLYLEKGRTFVPARPLAEALGAKVGWDEATNSVQVYTKNYVETKVQDGAKVWSMPANGFQVRTPLGFQRQEIETSLLQVAMATEHKVPVVVSVNRIPVDGNSLATQAAELAKALPAVYQGLKLDSSATQEEAGRITLWGTMDVAGETAGAAVRLVESKEGNWFFFSLYPNGSEGYKTMVTEIMGSLTEQ